MVDVEPEQLCKYEGRASCISTKQDLHHLARCGPSRYDLHFASSSLLTHRCPPWDASKQVNFEHLRAHQISTALATYTTTACVNAWSTRPYGDVPNSTSGKQEPLNRTVRPSLKIFVTELRPAHQEDDRVSSKRAVTRSTAVS